MDLKKQYTTLILILLSIIAFSPVFTAGFVLYDDPEYILNNAYVHQFSAQNIKAIFAGKASDIYVPLTILSYTIEHSLFGMQPKVFHITNLLLHIVNSLLLLQLLRKLSINAAFTLLLGIFFALNPLVTESVCWITERKDVLYALFFLSSAICFLTYTETNSKKHLLFSFLLFILACISKPMAVSLPVLLGIYLYYKNNSFKFNRYIALIPFIAVSVIISMMNARIIQSEKAYVNQLQEYSITGKAVLLLSETGYYFLKPFMPFAQQLIHFFPEEKNIYQGTFFWFAVGGFMTLVLLICFIYKKKLKTLALLLLAWLAILAPVIQIITNTHSYVSERYFYLTIIFPAAMLLYLAGYYQIKFTNYTAFILGIALVFAGLSFKRSQQWKNTKTLFEHELRINPENHLALNNLGLYYNRQSEFNRSLPLLKKAVNLQPENSRYLANYGWALSATGQIDSALILLNKAIHIDPNNTEALSNMGICHIQKQQREKAFPYFYRAYRINPGNRDVLYNLGVYYFNSGEKEKAGPLLQKARQLGNTKAEKYLQRL